MNRVFMISLIFIPLPYILNAINKCIDAPNRCHPLLWLIHQIPTLPSVVLAPLPHHLLYCPPFFLLLCCLCLSSSLFGFFWSPSFCLCLCLCLCLLFFPLFSLTFIFLSLSRSFIPFFSFSFSFSFSFVFSFCPFFLHHFVSLIFFLPSMDTFESLALSLLTDFILFCSLFVSLPFLLLLFFSVFLFHLLSVSVCVCV